MHIIHRKGWEIAEREATPEHLFLNRRSLLKAGAALGAAFYAVDRAHRRVAIDNLAKAFPARTPADRGRCRNGRGVRNNVRLDQFEDAPRRALVRAGVFADVVDVGGGFPSVYPGMIPPALHDYMDSIHRGFAAMDDVVTCRISVVTRAPFMVTSNAKAPLLD